MSNKYKFRDPEAIYFVSYTVVNWIDVFTRNLYREIMLDSFRYCQKEKNLIIYSYVPMTNHVHMIISSEENSPVENIMRDLKKFTSVKLINEIKNNLKESRKEWMLEIFKREGERNSNNTIYQFWQQDNHPIILDTNEMKEQRLDYIHNNPVTAGFVNKPEDYPWSSAQDYAGIKGPIQITLLD